MICKSCLKNKPESEMNIGQGYCRVCWKKIMHKRYRQKRKAQISKYFKKWYEEKGRYSRKKKNLPVRNKKLYKMYVNRWRRHLAVDAIARIFQISTSTAYQIIKKERDKQ